MLSLARRRTNLTLLRCRLVAIPISLIYWASTHATGENSARILEPRFEAVTTFNTSTSSVEFYGVTSTFAFARSLNKSLAEFERQEESGGWPSKRPRLSVSGPEAVECSFDWMAEDNTHAPTDSHRQRWKLREHIANAHAENFFGTVHNILPVLDPEVFWAGYHKFWNSPPSEVETVTSRQWQCLIYSVLAMGAMYSNTGANEAEWAANYFAEAQELLGNLFSATCLETVQATIFMVPLSGIFGFYGADELQGLLCSPGDKT